MKSIETNLVNFVDRFVGDEDKSRLIVACVIGFILLFVVWSLFSSEEELITIDFSNLSQEEIEEAAAP